jgi:nicotinamide-nucleotide amidase
VEDAVLEKYGAVSKEAVLQMVERGLHVSNADIGIAVSGIAGPEGGSPDKPVGTVWIAVKRRESQAVTEHFLFKGSRVSVRRRSAVAGMLIAEKLVKGVQWLDSSLNKQYI